MHHSCTAQAITCLFHKKTGKRKDPSNRGLWALPCCYCHVGGPCVYMIRSVNCFKDNSTVYFCEKGAVFPYSEELVITWLATLSISTIITILALQKVSDFLGYKAILHQLKFLPSYWTLMILLFVSLTSYVKLAISAKSINSWMILMGLAFNYILRTLFVGWSIGRLSGVSHRL